MTKLNAEFYVRRAVKAKSSKEWLDQVFNLQSFFLARASAIQSLAMKGKIGDAVALNINTFTPEWMKI